MNSLTWITLVFSSLAVAAYHLEQVELAHSRAGEQLLRREEVRRQCWESVQHPEVSCPERDMSALRSAVATWGWRGAAVAGGPDIRRTLVWLLEVPPPAESGAGVVLAAAGDGEVRQAWERMVEQCPLAARFWTQEGQETPAWVTRILYGALIWDAVGHPGEARLSPGAAICGWQTLQQNTQPWCDADPARSNLTVCRNLTCEEHTPGSPPHPLDDLGMPLVLRWSHEYPPDVLEAVARNPDYQDNHRAIAVMAATRASITRGEQVDLLRRILADDDARGIGVVVALEALRLDLSELVDDIDQHRSGQEPTRGMVMGWVVEQLQALPGK